jgi:toxin ParE1/3/4
MPKYDFLISVKAKEDLQLIWEYTLENWSENQADDYYFSIFNKIEQLCDHPLSGIDCEFIKPGYRKSWIKSHVIFYRIASNHKIEIIRILHQKQDVNPDLFL